MNEAEKEWVAHDRRLAGAVRTALMDCLPYEHDRISVEVHGSIATLRGVVLDERTRTLAVKAATRTPQVADVNDELVVKGVHDTSSHVTRQANDPLENWEKIKKRFFPLLCVEAARKLPEYLQPSVAAADIAMAVFDVLKSKRENGELREFHDRYDFWGWLSKTTAYMVKRQPRAFYREPLNVAKQEPDASDSRDGTGRLEVPYSACLGHPEQAARDVEAAQREALAAAGVAFALVPETYRRVLLAKAGLELVDVEMLEGSPQPLRKRIVASGCGRKTSEQLAEEDGCTQANIREKWRKGRRCFEEYLRRLSQAYWNKLLDRACDILDRAQKNDTLRRGSLDFLSALEDRVDYLEPGWFLVTTDFWRPLLDGLVATRIRLSSTVERDNPNREGHYAEEDADAIVDDGPWTGPPITRAELRQDAAWLVELAGLLVAQLHLKELDFALRIARGEPALECGDGEFDLWWRPVVLILQKAAKKLDLVE